MKLLLVSTSVILQIHLLASVDALGQAPEKTLPRCEAVPLGNGAVSLQVDGEEIVRWNSGLADVGKKAHFYPVRTRRGADLTRMGHPGAPNHDHHRSLWFGHMNVGGQDFWGEGKGASIVQKQWIAYSDTDNAATLAVLLGWNGADGKEILEQELVAELAVGASGEAFLEIQSVFRPTDKRVTIGKTNFGFMGVRVSKMISAYFGGGKLTDSEGREGEEAIFGQRAHWVDYTGLVSTGTGKMRKQGVGGVTWFDHPSNPRYPTHWHVRSDGWMGASFCFAEPYDLEVGKELVLRYLFHLRDDAYDAKRAGEIAAAFAKTTGYLVEKSSEPHTASEIKRQEPK